MIRVLREPEIGRIDRVRREPETGRMIRVRRIGLTDDYAPKRCRAR